MTLADFATFTTAVSGLAVTASLIYLALQTHQNAKHTRAMIHQGRVGALRDVFLATADADLARTWIVMTGGEPTPQAIQQRQFISIVGAMIYGWQDTYLQYKEGLLDDDFYRQMRTGVEAIMAFPAGREAWGFFRVPGTDFAAFMDSIATAVAARTAPEPG